MAWIEAHQSLENHPKTKKLSRLMGWDLDVTLGKLFRFWWWCVDYCEDGDLSKLNDDDIGDAVGLAGEDATKFVEAMVESCWIDRAPYFRVHDWWDYIGLFLQRKYGNKKPEKWRRVKELYSGCTSSVQQLAQPNQPNQPNQPKKAQASPAIFQVVLGLGFNPWVCAYKLKAERKWTKDPPEEVLVKVCERYVQDKKKNAIRNDYAWFKAVFCDELKNFNAEKNEKEGDALKEEPVANIGGLVEDVSRNMAKI